MGGAALQLLETRLSSQAFYNFSGCKGVVRQSMLDSIGSISGALVRTGLLDAVANRVVMGAGQRPVLGTAAFLLATILASGLMNNTPVVLILIPVVTRLARNLKIATTCLLIPLSYTAVLGGTWTLVGTSTNLLVDGVARDLGMEPFSIFEITPVGWPAPIEWSSISLNA